MKELDKLNTTELQELEQLKDKPIEDLTIAEGLKLLEYMRSWKARQKLMEERGETVDPNSMRTNDGRTLKFTEL